MQNKIKFLADEHIDLPAVEALKNKGTDIVSLRDCGLLGSSDENVAQFAYLQGRIIVTRDRDFLVMHSKKQNHNGIVFLTKQLNTGEIIREIEIIEILYASADLANYILYIPQKH